jgi:hypothetical protein
VSEIQIRARAIHSGLALAATRSAGVPADLAVVLSKVHARVGKSERALYRCKRWCFSNVDTSVCIYTTAIRLLNYCEQFCERKKEVMSENTELHSIEVCIIDIYVKEKKL